MSRNVDSGILAAAQSERTEGLIRLAKGGGQTLYGPHHRGRETTS